MLLGIDIGGTGIKAGLVNDSGDVVAHTRWATGSFAAPHDLINAVWAWWSGDLAAPALEGIGIGAPNGNYYKGSIEFAPNLPWKGVVPLADMFRARFGGLPVVLSNDANAAALGEMLYGAAKDLRDFIVITLGTGLGSGVVANGKLVYGHDGFAGELGHCIVRRQGRLCGCGRQGCLETYASVTGLLHTARELSEEQPKRASPALEQALRERDGALLHRIALEGDVLAWEAFVRTGEELGFGLALAATLTSPQAFIFFGGLAAGGDLLLQSARRSMEQNLLPIFRDKIEFRLSGVPFEYAGILGAAALVRHHSL